MILPWYQDRHGGSHHKGSFFGLFRRTSHHRSHTPENDHSSTNGTLPPSGSGLLASVPEENDNSTIVHPVRGNLNSIRSRQHSSQNVKTPFPMQTDTLQGFRSFYGHHHKQYTILAKKKYVSLLEEHWIISIDKPGYKSPTHLITFIRGVKS